MQFKDYKKCGISYFTMRILPLSKIDKEFLLNQDKNLLKNNNEYLELLNKIYVFKHSYSNTPIVQRFAIKESYKNELQEKFDEFYFSQKQNIQLKENQLEK